MNALLLVLPLCVGSTAAAQETPEPFAFTREIEAGEHVFTADFARIEVPQERSKPDSSSIQVAFCRLRCTAERAGPPLFYLVGVPASASRLKDSPEWADFWAECLKRGDVVLLDQRGTGESRPVLAWDSPAWEPWRLYGDVETAYEHALQSAAQARRELEAKRIVPAAFNVIESAEDIDAVRKAVGYERIHVMGHSAGSHLALIYLRRHPECVARLVSIGTAGPDDIMKPPSESDAALRKVAALGREAPELDDTGKDLEADLRKVLEDLDEDPLSIAISDPRSGKEVRAELGAFGLQLLLVQDLGDDRDLVVLPRLIHSLRQRDPSLVAWFLSKRVEQMAKMPLSMFAFRAASGASRERWERIDSESATSAFGRARALFCPELADELGIAPWEATFYAPVLSDVPALFVSGTLDAHTPPEQAERVRKGFSRSAHVVVENAGHETILYEPRVREAMLAFLEGKEVTDQTLPGPRLEFVALEGPVDSKRHPALEGAGGR